MGTDVIAGGAFETCHLPKPRLVTPLQSEAQRSSELSRGRWARSDPSPTALALPDTSEKHTALSRAVQSLGAASTELLAWVLRRAEAKESTDGHQAAPRVNAAPPAESSSKVRAPSHCPHAVTHSEPLLPLLGQVQAGGLYPWCCQPRGAVPRASAPVGRMSCFANPKQGFCLSGGWEKTGHPQAPL